tara:strand:- start:713 stop:1204 length:492 start_codon:yes stop_codon:yes gene_type:complete
MKSLLNITLSVLLFSIFACEESENWEQAEKLTFNWELTEYWVDSADIKVTLDTTYGLTSTNLWPWVFNANGTLTVPNGTSTISGTWESLTSNGNSKIKISIPEITTGTPAITLFPEAEYEFTSEGQAITGGIMPTYGVTLTIKTGAVTVAKFVRHTTDNFDWL